MREFNKSPVEYPSTEQFRNAIKNLVSTSPKRIVLFQGTVKVHGTNGSIRRYPDGTYMFQSKECNLNESHDNAGFYAYMNSLPSDAMNSLFAHYVNKFPGFVIQICGEWFGANIQKAENLGVMGLEKHFMVFGAAIIDPSTQQKTWMTTTELELASKAYVPSHNIFYGNAVWCKHITIDIDDPMSVAHAQSELAELTNEVEASCPIAKHFGKDGVGEGVVWKPVGELGKFSEYWFKVKGAKHSSSKTKQLAPANIEQLESIEKFVEYSVTESRVAQAIQETGAQDIKDTATVIKWVMGDIVKEESDTLEQNNLTMKLVSGACSKSIVSIFKRLIA